MYKKGFLVVVLVVLVCKMQAQDIAPIVIPTFNDTYCNTIKQLEDGHTNINYRAFRESFIESDQFVVAHQQKPTLDSLTRAMNEAMHYKNYNSVINITHQMLSIDYTNMMAHKILQQTYKVTGDTADYIKYHNIEFGLLKSIITSGDGKTCETAWPVIQIEEEYFILEMYGAKLLQQSIDNTGGLCDKMDTQTKQGNKTFYFETTKVFEGYHKLGLQ